MGDVAGDFQITFAVGFGHQVLEQQVGCVVHQTSGFLQAGSGGRNLTARQRGVAHGARVTLQDQHFRTAFIGGQSGNRSASPRSNDEHLHMAGKLGLIRLEHRHR